MIGILSPLASSPLPWEREDDDHDRPLDSASFRWWQIIFDRTSDPVGPRFCGGRGCRLCAAIHTASAGTYVATARSVMQVCCHPHQKVASAFQGLN